MPASDKHEHPAQSEDVVDQRVELVRRRWRHDAGAAQPAVGSPKLTAAPKLCIALSREAGAGGSDVARQIGQRLDWPVYDREILDLIAQRSVLRTELLESLDEHDRPWLLEIITALGHPQGISSAGYLRHLQDVLAALASRGRCVLVGRGGAGLLPPERTLRVRVIAPLDQRVQRIARRQNLSDREAEQQTRSIDKERAHFMARHFHKDLNDPHGFDLILNTARIPPPACADIVARAVQAREAAVAPGSPPAKTATSS